MDADDGYQLVALSTDQFSRAARIERRVSRDSGDHARIDQRHFRGSLQSQMADALDPADSRRAELGARRSGSGGPYPSLANFFVYLYQLIRGLVRRPGAPGAVSL